MNRYPITNATALEKMLFDAGIVTRVDLSVIYDVKAGTAAQRSWQRPEVCRTQPNIHEAQSWDDKLHACIRGEFFGEAMRFCQLVLDVGCGEGFPSLYLATLLPQVVGIDVSPAHLALARNTARLMGLRNVRFEQASIEDLPFADGAFDGVCFGGNVFTYGYDPRRMLSEIGRVLASGGPSAGRGGTFAFEQRPGDPAQPSWEKILWFIDGGPPILHYGAGVGLRNREYLIYLDPQCAQGKRIADLSQRVRDEYLTAEQIEAFEEVKTTIESGHLEVVQQVWWAGEGCSLGAEEFPALLEEAGFTEVTSWALPDAVVFAESLASQGALGRLVQADLRPCIRALVKSARASSGWQHECVTCRKR
jgi:SAM-dependent methyltransferase